MKVINLIDPKGRISLMYNLKSEKNGEIHSTKLEKLEVKSQDLGDKTRRSFYLDIAEKKEEEILVLSIMREQIFVNLAIVSENIFKLSSVSTKVDFIETKTKGFIEVYYTPTAERKIFVIDIETGDEVEPEFNITATGETKGIINLEIGKKYITIELRDVAYKTILLGACQLFIEDDILKLGIKKEEAKMIRLDKYVELIKSGKCIEQKLIDASPEKER